jgi:hypothetical protein
LQESFLFFSWAKSIFKGLFMHIYNILNSCINVKQNLVNVAIHPLAKARGLLATTVLTLSETKSL